MRKQKHKCRAVQDYRRSGTIEGEALFMRKLLIAVVIVSLVVKVSVRVIVNGDRARVLAHAPGGRSPDKGSVRLW